MSFINVMISSHNLNSIILNLMYSLPSVWGTWLVQSVEHVTLDLGFVSSGPVLGIELTLKKKKMLS